MSRHGAWRKLLKPRVLLPLVLAGALFFVAVSLGNLGQVTGRIEHMQWTAWLLVPGFAAVYLAGKALQLHLLLRNLDVRPDWRRFLLAFAMGELALTLPLGVFAQNAVLAGDRDIDFGRSAAATVLMLLMEMALVLLWLAVIGIPGWSPVQPLAALALAGLSGALFVGLHFRASLARLAGRVKTRWLQRVLAQVVGLVDGLHQLSSLRMLVLSALLVPLYLGALGLAFLIVGHGVGVPRLGYVEAATIYAFSLAAILLTGGLSGQVGTVEVVGMSAARAFGLDYTDGLALMLGFRLAWTGSIWLLCGPPALALRHAGKHESPVTPVRPETA